MIRHNQGGIKLTKMVDLPPQSSKWRVGGKEVLRRNPSDGKHDTRPQQLNLTH